MAPWWWFLCKPKHVGAALIILIRFNNCTCFTLCSLVGIIKWLILYLHYCNGNHTIMCTAHSMTLSLSQDTSSLGSLLLRQVHSLLQSENIVLHFCSNLKKILFNARFPTRILYVFHVFPTRPLRVMFFRRENGFSMILSGQMLVSVLSERAAVSLSVRLYVQGFQFESSRQWLTTWLNEPRDLLTFRVVVL